MSVLVIGGVGLYSYLTQPERVFGARSLDCPPTQIQWFDDADRTVITGCGRSLDARCSGNPAVCTYDH